MDYLKEKYERYELEDEIENLERKNKSLIHQNSIIKKKINHFKSSKAYKVWHKYARLKDGRPSAGDKNVKNLKDIKVALIADQFTYDSYKYEFDVIKLTPDNWKDQFTYEKPDLFFCESAWDGFDFEGDYGPWYEQIYNDYRVDYENRTVLLEIIEYCNENSIPTVFWNKEDPTSYRNEIRSFAETACKFDYIFTSAKECVEKYKNEFNHPHVYNLMFAAQPRLFNPLKLSNEHKKGVAFAGSYYNGYKERARMMDDIFDRLIENDVELVIYDRNYYLDCCFYPEKYHKYIKPPIDYDETPKLYRDRDWCLNFNTVNQSETMFARRIFELSLSYTNILTNYSVGVDKIFGDNVFVFDRTDELPDFDRDYDEERLNNLYNVLENHTYKKRWMEILDKIGFEYSDDLNDVTVIYNAEDLAGIDEIVENFEDIDYSNKTLNLLVNCDEDISNLKDKYPQIDEIYDDYQKLRDEIDTEYWIVADEHLDSDFIKKAILHYQYLNKRVGIGDTGNRFEITVENNIENKIFNRINRDYLIDSAEFLMYSI